MSRMVDPEPEPTPTRPAPAARPEPKSSAPPKSAAAAEEAHAAPTETPKSDATPKKSEGRVRGRPAVAARASVPKAKKEAGPKAPNRPTLDPETRRLLGERRRQDSRRPLFVRQQAHRYFALGRWDTWRRP
ncbi:MAG: hypothetical protein ACYDFT_08550, partial [Thermoplasmata archaeon]